MRLKKYSVLYLVLLAILFVYPSCSEDTPQIPQEEVVEDEDIEDEDVEEEILEQIVTLSENEVTLEIDDEIILIPEFGDFDIPKRTYSWQVENPDIIDISENEDYSATITAIKEGETLVIFKSKDDELKAECKITVIDSGDGIVRILAIGNSFSQDALEYYLYGLADAEDIKVEIGNLYIGGASLDLHLTNAVNNKDVYQYRVIDEEGNKTNTQNTSIGTALTDKDWDYVSFQQHSPYSGKYDSYTYPLPRLFNYVKEKTTNSKVKYVLHQTWAYEQTSTHSGFAGYNNDQMTMYNAIVDAVWRAKDLVDIDIVVPAGTAIQNGRTSIIGDNFCRDGYHLDVNIGRYTASCAWFETIFGKNVVGNSYKPTTLSEYEAEIAQNAAYFAVTNPKEVTEMVDFQTVGTSVPLTDPVFISFGLTDPVEGWNGFFGWDGSQKGAYILNLKDSKGKETGISARITETFNSRNTNGELATSTEFNIPSSISKYNFYGNSTDTWGEKDIKQSTFVLSGLLKDKKYNLCYFGSRGGVSVRESREVKFISKGSNEVIVNLESANNKSNIVCANNMQPDDKGEIAVTVTAGDKNNNKYGFYHITAMRISPAN